ncbi:MAG: hypothetical protein MRY64_11140 [Hyphomonadaceae bacterium]|nr:hypothetical protein [Hyphomonadaceae bacterium]
MERERFRDCATKIPQPVIDTSGAFVKLQKYFGGWGMVKSFYLSLGFLCLSACVANIDEIHYFATQTTPTPENPSGIVNIFRVEIDATAAFSNVRYIAGEYDERAVDLFINETKATNYSAQVDLSMPATAPIFTHVCSMADKPDDMEADAYREQCIEDYKNRLALIRVAGGDDGKDPPIKESFVFIFSTDANAISETIGAIAENRVAMESLNALLHKDTFDELSRMRTLSTLEDQKAKATLDTLTRLFQRDGESPYAEDASADSMRDIAILRTIAVAMEPGASVNFNTYEEAEAWFSARN